MNRTTRKRTIKARLKMKGLTYRDIAAAAGVSVHTVSTIINRYPVKKSFRIQKAISLAIGKDFSDLWGDVAPRVAGRLAGRNKVHDEAANG